MEQIEFNRKQHFEKDTVEIASHTRSGENFTASMGRMGDKTVYRRQWLESVGVDDSAQLEILLGN